MNRALSIRTRTAIYIAAAFTLFLSLFFLLSYYSIHRSLLNRSDDETRDQIRAILFVLERQESASSMDSLILRHNSTGEGVLHIALYKELNGELVAIPEVASSGEPTVSSESLSALKAHPELPVSISIGGSSKRLVAYGSEHYLGIAAMDTIVIDESQDAMLKQFGIMLIFGILASSVIGYLVAGISLSPIIVLIDAAKKLRSPGSRSSSESGMRRLPIPKGVPEVALLATAVNRLIDEREASIDQLRNFTADAAHELRTPLTVLKGELEVELRVMDGSNPSYDLLRSNLEEVERLIAIVEDLLLLAKLDQAENISQSGTEPLSIREMILAAASRLEGLAIEKRISLTKDFDGDAKIVAVRERFERLLYNIILNALSYTDVGGNVCIELHSKQSPAFILVRDTGIGIPEDSIPQVFERFYRSEKSRTRQSGGGAGLGLSIAKSIAEQFGCTIRIESVFGKGTSVFVVLPGETPDGA